MSIFDRSMNPMAGIAEIRVTIIGTAPETGRVMARDSYGNQIEIDASNRPKGVGFPHEGERWSITKTSGQWYLKTQLGNPSVPTITGSRNGISPILNQVLDALVSQGMVLDETTGEPSDSVLPDPIPYVPGDPEYLDPAVGTDLIGEDPITTPIPEDYSGPSTVETPDPLAPVSSRGSYTEVLASLYVGTFNLDKSVGPRAFYQDLVRLSQTRLQIVGLQDCQGEERNEGFARAEELGWSAYRPKTAPYSDDPTIIWRTDLFDLISSGVQEISATSVPGMPPRYLDWVKVLYKPANRVLYLLNTHLDPHLDVEPYTSHHIGKPNFDQYETRVTDSIAQIASIATKIKTFSAKAPVILTGNFNIGATVDAKVRYKGFPYAKFGAVGAKSNWSAIPHDVTGPATSINQIWLARGNDWHIRFVQHWGLSGYASNHHPLMAQFAVRAKS